MNVSCTAFCFLWGFSLIFFVKGKSQKFEAKPKKVPFTTWRKQCMKLWKTINMGMRINYCFLDLIRWLITHLSYLYIFWFHTYIRTQLNVCYMCYLFLANFVSLPGISMTISWFKFQNCHNIRFHNSMKTIHNKTKVNSCISNVYSVHPYNIFMYIFMIYDFWGRYF